MHLELLRVRPRLLGEHLNCLRVGAGLFGEYGNLFGMCPQLLSIGARLLRQRLYCLGIRLCLGCERLNLLQEQREALPHLTLQMVNPLDDLRLQNLLRHPQKGRGQHLNLFRAERAREQLLYFLKRWHATKILPEFRLRSSFFSTLPNIQPQPTPAAPEGRLLPPDRPPADRAPTRLAQRPEPKTTYNRARRGSR